MHGYPVQVCAVCLYSVIIVSGSITDADVKGSGRRYLLNSMTCQDQVNCHQFPTNYCSVYEKWCKINCARYCEFCTDGIATPTSRYGIFTMPTNTWSSWSGWYSCSVTCGLGTKTRFRSCRGLDTCTGHSSEQSICYIAACPTDTPCLDQINCYPLSQDVCSGKYAEWARIKCAKFCGFCSYDRATSTSRYGVFTMPTATWSSWSSWSSCSLSCGAGTKTRFRSCRGLDTCTGYNNETSTCYRAPCPRDGGWGTWSPYSACSVTCCTGHMTRSRSCDNPTPADNGHACSGAAKESKSCSNPCIGDAQWSVWQAWGSCSASCGAGDQSRTRTCTGQTVCTGPCPGNNTSFKSCDLGACPNWSPWFFGACSATCGTGTKQGLRRCSSGHEEDCTGPSMKTENCTVQPCAVDGGWGSWQSWGTCSKTCGDGTRSRQRACDSPTPSHGGKTCRGSLRETELCKVMDCPRWGAYYEVVPCSVTCGVGVIHLQRNCSTGNNHDCTGSPYDEKPCTRPAC